MSCPRLISAKSINKIIISCSFKYSVILLFDALCWIDRADESLACPAAAL